MAARRVMLALLIPLMLGACGDDDDKKALPPPKELTSEAIGHYCNMVVIEHPGPKGQILLKSSDKPVWFSSVRDTVVFTLLPEEPKDIVAIYVNDMGKADWTSPASDTWIEARGAWFVIASAKKSGMDTAEAIPFSEKSKAEQFVKENGGKVVTWTDIPRDYVIDEQTNGNKSAEGSEPSHDMGDHEMADQAPDAHEAHQSGDPQ